jgi:CheY-like chemotaxis protein
MDPRILIVDDDASSCDLVKEVLVHATGMEVVALKDSKAASACLAKERFGVILLDYQMPSPDGAELAARCASPA